ncbi:oligosaccharide flippase family protein [Altererythrobacter sp. KTW20L]|uniref:oligosaccharide flippase family protein n=1 Tax=Altererythrobacter sp. KTW20L TaxID=2942210 RepID=UPI0020BEF109|nr:oligosaccharide flippase family protein [Altererythrobacter sp. KTW20L]MCL6250416.1 oligosaccharide flippase family protein [Altererythrobacter sp. KTW20L]
MSVRSAAVWAMASQYGAFVIQFATSVIISRFFLAPDEVGLFSIALAAAMLVAVLQDFGLSRYISGLPDLSADEVNRCSSVAFIFSLLIVGAIAALAWPLAAFYGLPQLAPLLVIIAGSYLFLPMSVVPLALMARTMRFSGHFAVNVGGAMVHATVALTLAWLGYSAFALAWAVLATGLAKGLIAQVLQPARTFPLRLDGLRPVLTFGGKASTLYMTGALGSRSPDLIVGRLVDLFAVGLFSRASSLAEQFRSLIAGAIGGVFYPAFARIRDSGQPLAPAYLRVVAGYTAVVWPGMAGLALAAWPLVNLLYGEVWIDTAPLLTLIALQAALMMSLPLVSELPILLGRMNRLLVLNILETILSIALLVVGSLWAGAWGAAASRLVYAVCFMAIYLGFMRGLVGFAMADWLAILGKSLGVSVAALAPLGLTYMLWQGPQEITFPMLLLAVAAGGIGWVAALFALKHPALDDMRRMAAQLVRPLLPQVGAWLEMERAR